MWIRLYQFLSSLWCRGLNMDQTVSVPSSLWCRGIDMDQTVSVPEFTLV